MGLRLVPLSLEVIRELLLGDAPRGVPENVPKDIKIIGSVTKEDLLVAGGIPPRRSLAYPPNAVMLLCESEEWEGFGDPEHRGEIGIFEPTFRRRS